MALLSEQCLLEPLSGVAILFGQRVLDALHQLPADVVVEDDALPLVGQVRLDMEEEERKLQLRAKKC
jgi:hypothetical protein